MPATLMPVTGIIQNVTSFSEDCCEQQVTIRSDNGISQFIISPDTYVIGEVRLRPGMPVAAFYDVGIVHGLVVCLSICRGRPARWFRSDSPVIYVKQSAEVDHHIEEDLLYEP